MNETMPAATLVPDGSGETAYVDGNLTDGLSAENPSLGVEGLLALALNASGAERCRLQQQAEELLQDVACPSFFDMVSCWPRTPPGTLAVLPCFAELKGVQYDSSRKYLLFLVCLIMQLSQNKLRWVCVAICLCLCFMLNL
uniref:G-protein coupled receptors family 2 profile 1 domain-containing protein n=1 Tax=Anopheles maculatus TaxID=74869 RepID=A0A182SYS4_9DIPT